MGDSFLVIMRFGIVCDIDGVLVKEKQVIEPAMKALLALQDEEKKQFRVPLLFVTNGGDYTPTSRAQALAQLFPQVPDITAQRMIVAHTPLQAHHDLQEKNLLLFARQPSVAHEVAKEYGWKQYQVASELCDQVPFLFPQQDHNCSSDLISRPFHETHPFDAVILLSTPHHWEHMLQMASDALLPQEGKQKVKFYAANPDLVYSTEYCQPRYTTGAFVSCLKTLYHEWTGVPLEVEWLGKPYESTYRYAEQVIREQYPDVTHYYAIGDNPLSDIQGAHRAGENWHSILVSTGVHTSKENHKDFPADHMCEDVYQAIQYILSCEKEKS